MKYVFSIIALCMFGFLPTFGQGIGGTGGIGGKAGIGGGGGGGGGMTQCGVTTTTGSPDNFNINSETAVMQCTTDSHSYTVNATTSVSIYGQPQLVDGNMQAAIYAGACSAPGALLCSSGSVAVTTGAMRWVALPLTGCGTLAPSSNYCIAYNTDTTWHIPITSSSGYGTYENNTYGNAWLNPFGTPSGTWGYYAPGYIHVTAQ